jgi:paraquat-inducible protein A
MEIRCEKRLIGCHGCGLVHTVGTIPPGTVAKCQRCGETLAGAPRMNFTEHLMLYLAAAILFVVAHTFPFMALEIEGRRQVTTVFDGVRALYDSGSQVLAIIVFVTGTLAPALRIGFAIALYFPLALGRVPRRLVFVMRALTELRPWAMMEIYLFAVIVAYVKLIELADIELGLALAAFIAVILILVVLDGDHEPHSIWTLLQAQASDRSVHVRPSALLCCHECHQVMEPNRHHCSRCGAPVHHRKPASLSVAWALLLTAFVFLFPANLMPIMTVTSFGTASESTIVGGVIELVHHEMYPIAAVVFIASVAVPFLKLIGLAYIYTSVTLGWERGPKDRAFMYHIIELIGRWSMIDIFVIALLAALVALGNIATIEAGPAALSFCGVVIISMLSAMSFDSRLIWDKNNG